VKYLLDTHVFLWAVTADPKLSSRAKQIFTGDHELWFSVAGVWEILTKVQIGKLPLPSPAGAYVSAQLVQNNIRVLPITLTHALHLERLPLHHRDPFDRVLIAQSLEEELPIVTADPLLASYSATLVW
jgi:PIN domain nuclease of toxin-antitoxin system